MLKISRRLLRKQIIGFAKPNSWQKKQGEPMRRQFGILAITLLMSGLAFAEAQEAAAIDESFSASLSGEAATVEVLKAGPCSQIKATEAQKAAMKKAFQEFQTSAKGLRASAKAAHMQYFKLVSEPKVDVATAQAAANDVATSAAHLMAARLNFKTQVLFQILTPEQRGPAMKCEMQHRKHKKHRHGHQHKAHKKPAPKMLTEEFESSEITE